jgi:hypothetical protein
MRDVLKNLIDGLTDAWVKVGKYWRTPMFISNNLGQTHLNEGKNVIITSVFG